MKKTKFLASALIVAVMLMGSGYAAWKDNLTINNTVQTGVMHVKFVNNDMDKNRDLKLKYPDTCKAEYVNANVKISEENENTVEVTMDNLYSGAWAAFRLKAMNAGTIPVKFDSVDVEFNGDKDPNGDLSILKYLTYEVGLKTETDFKKVDNIIKKKEKQMKLSGSLANIKKDFEEKMKNFQDIQLEPNGMDSFYLGIPKDEKLNEDNEKCGNLDDTYMVIRYKGDAPNSTQKKTLKFTIKFNFKQFNQ